MEAFFLDFGYFGMFLAAFLAGTIAPFSSEAIQVALLAMGLSPWGITLSATLGNTLGGVTCYLVGLLCKLSLIERYFHVSHEKLLRVEKFVHRYGAWMGFFSFLPVFGEAICIALGLLRTPFFATLLTMLLGKLLRYTLLMFATEGITSLF